MRFIMMSLVIGLLGVPLAAQTPPEMPDPSPEKESFVMQPAAVDKGAKDFAVRMVSNEPGGFSNSSSKPPEVKFSAGVKLVVGSLRILNPNEAECRIDVEDDTIGTCEVSVELYSVNGTTVLRTLRATLGIKGTGSVQGSQAEVGVESVKLVRVNIEDPQPAGVIVISGAIAGSVSIAAPTGTNFAGTPTVLIDQGDINSPVLAQANTVFNFSIGNPGLEHVTVRVTEIEYNTQLFGVTGGAEGDLACEVSGAALSGQQALVVNAFTAKTAIEGSNDNTEPPPSNTGSESSPSTETGTSAPRTGGGINNPQPRRDNNTRPDRPNNRDNNRDNNRNARPANPFRPRPPSNPAPTINRPRALPNSRGGNPAPQPAPAGGGRVSPAGGAGGATMAGTGSIKEERAGADKAVVSDRREPPRELEVSPGLYFCDEDFKPVSALVLDKLVNDEAGGRIWIVLKLEKDKDPNKVETVTVKFTIGGATRELTLTETGANTGEFRCAKEGILVVANENPNSNEVEKEPEPPKARFPK